MTTHRDRHRAIGVTDDHPQVILVSEPLCDHMDFSKDLPVCWFKIESFDTTTTMGEDETCSCCTASDDEYDDYIEVVPVGNTAMTTTSRVRFQSYTAVREYAVTVGDAPTCHDSCPMTLDWAYRTTRQSLATPSHRRRTRRLSLEQRRRRIAVVQGWSREQVRALEIERVLTTFDETMEQNQFADDEEEEQVDNNNNDELVNHRLSMAAISREIEDIRMTWKDELGLCDIPPAGTVLTSNA